MSRLRQAHLDARALARVTPVHLRLLAVALACASGLAACTRVEVSAPPSPTPTRAPLQMQSDAFTDGAAIPTAYTCEGQNVSPPLRWTGVPDDAVELALLVYDDDAPAGRFTHWAVFGIDPAVTGIELNKVPRGATEGRNSFNTIGYRGPCPPRGDPDHGYVFVLSALRGPVALDAGAGPDEIRRAIDALTIASGTLTGTFRRN